MVDTGGSSEFQEDQAAGGETNLERVREILFGAQVKENDRRFSRLEERLAKEISDLRDEARRRFESLESYVKSELASVKESLRKEHHEREGSLRELSSRLADQAELIEKRLRELDERSQDSEQRLRAQILEQSQGLRDELLQCREDLLNDQRRAADELRRDKVDQSALAGLFAELALRFQPTEEESPVDPG